jgi:hypothetical protein
MYSALSYVCACVCVYIYTHTHTHTHSFLQTCYNYLKASCNKDVSPKQEKFLNNSTGCPNVKFMYI